MSRLKCHPSSPSSIKEKKINPFRNSSFKYMIIMILLSQNFFFFLIGLFTLKKQLDNKINPTIDKTKICAIHILQF